MSELVTKAFAQQCMSFPDKVDAALEKISTPAQAKGLLDNAATMQAYARQLKAGVEIERPISLGVLKIKAKLGELMPAEKGGRGKTRDTNGTSLDLDRRTIATYRKLAASKDRLDEFYDEIDDVPTQTEFLRWCGADRVMSAGTGEMDWYTPERYIDAARAAMGGIDLDPATSKHAQEIVQATQWYDAESDGLTADWSGRVFLNPPYKMPLIEQFVFKLCDHVEAQDVSQAILLTNNSTDPKWWQRAARLADAVCFTAGRIKFYNRAGEFSAPTNGQTFCYFGRARKRFEKHFHDIGVILHHE